VWVYHTYGTMYLVVSVKESNEGCCLALFDILPATYKQVYIPLVRGTGTMEKIERLKATRQDFASSLNI
jgi:hypothetical protein